jgi:hypothetical protein
MSRAANGDKHSALYQHCIVASCCTLPLMPIILLSNVQTLSKFFSLKVITYFGQYGHHQVLYLTRKPLLFVVAAIACVGPLDAHVWL